MILIVTERERKLHQVQTSLFWKHTEVIDRSSCFIPHLERMSVCTAITLLSIFQPSNGCTELKTILHFSLLSSNSWPCPDLLGAGHFSTRTDLVAQASPPILISMILWKLHVVSLKPWLSKRKKIFLTHLVIANKKCLANI